jgi:hypothetical protein
MNMYNYLIDDKIVIYENDTLIIKFQKILLKYKKIIAIILLITLLIIGYLCNIQNLYLNNSNNDKNHSCILNGGYKSVYAAKIKEGASDKMASGKAGILNAPGNIKTFGANRAEDAKDLAPWFYGIIYSVSIALLSFLIFVPAIGFIIVGLICYVLLKGKISYIKSL